MAERRRTGATLPSGASESFGDVGMRFLVKSAFWLSLVLLLVPFGGGDGADDRPAVGAVEAFLAVRALASDMAGICERRPDVCEVGREAMHTIGVRAREGAGIAIEMLGERPADTSGAHAGSGELHTGSVPVPSERVEPAAD